MWKVLYICSDPFICIYEYVDVQKSRLSVMLCIHVDCHYTFEFEWSFIR